MTSLMDKVREVNIVIVVLSKAFVNISHKILTEKLIWAGWINSEVDWKLNDQDQWVVMVQNLVGDP